MFNSRSVLGFDGRYKRPLVQDLSGNKHASGEAILEKSRLERQKRAEERERIEKCKKIQAFMRGSLSRIHTRREAKKEYEDLMVSLTSTAAIDISTRKWRLTRMVLCFNYAYKPTPAIHQNGDLDKVLKLSSLFIQNAAIRECYQAITQELDQKTAHLWAKFIVKLTGTLAMFDRRHMNSSASTLGSVLRSLEILLDAFMQPFPSNAKGPQVLLMQLLLRHGLLQHLSHLVDEHEIASGGLVRLAHSDVASYCRRPWVSARLGLLMAPLRFLKTLPPSESSAELMSDFLQPYLRHIFYPPRPSPTKGSNALYMLVPSEVASACCKHQLVELVPTHILVKELLSVVTTPRKAVNVATSDAAEKHAVAQEYCRGVSLLHFVVCDMFQPATVDYVVRDYVVLVASALSGVTSPEAATTTHHTARLRLRGPKGYFRFSHMPEPQDELEEDDVEDVAQERHEGDDEHLMDVDSSGEVSEEGAVPSSLMEDENVGGVAQSRRLHAEILDTIWENFGPLLSHLLQQPQPQEVASPTIQKSTNASEDGVAAVCHILFTLLVVHNQKAEGVLRLGLCRGQVVSTVWDHLMRLLQQNRVQHQQSLFASALSSSTSSDTVALVRLFTPQLLAPALGVSRSSSATVHTGLVLHALLAWAFLHYFHMLTMEEAEVDAQLWQHLGDHVADNQRTGLGLLVTILKTALFAVIQLIHSPLIGRHANSSPEAYLHLIQWRRVFSLLQRAFLQLYHRSRRRRHTQAALDSWWLLEPMRNTPLVPQHLCRHDIGYLSPANIFRDPKYDVISQKDAVIMCILTELPFTLPFDRRLHLLQALISDSRRREQSHVNLPSLGDIAVKVNRARIFEDAYTHMSAVVNLRHRLRVEFTNEVGLDEAGIDGGGLTREFLTAIIRTAFDPNRGLFVTTEGQRRLYPNPTAETIFPDGMAAHFYHFVGRVLAKCIYESHLVELPLADFFLAKVLSANNSVCDVGFLHDLDPHFCSNLMSLKHQDVSQLSLYFTVTVDHLGRSEEKELKPNGAEIAVTEENKLEYIYLVADYKLNRQLHAQTVAMKAGLFDVVDMEWLQMFSPSELQMVISGSDAPIDIQDWKSHCHVQGGGETAAVVHFWQVVESLSEEERRQLLYFVTSCSRPPMFGFRDLHPPFTIQIVSAVSDGEEVSSNPAVSTARLPTVSTCMNLLKLPNYGSVQVMGEKLRRAISANAGFELS